MGKIRIIINHKGLLGNKDKTIKFTNGSEITFIGGHSSEGNSRGNMANLITLKDENGDVIEMDTRDNSYRVVWTKEELEED